MDEGYQGIDKANRIGCLASLAPALLAFVFLDLGRVLGDPAPGTEGAWWREVPFLAPTASIAVATYFIVRFWISRRQK